VKGSKVCNGWVTTTERNCLLDPALVCCSILLFA
jgi:hypothetical protein